MADEDGVRSLLVQFAEGIIGDRERSDGLPMLKPKPIRQQQLLQRTRDERVALELRGPSLATEHSKSRRAAACVAGSGIRNLAAERCRLRSDRRLRPRRYPTV